ncbi:flavodoxin family protein [Veillonella agrestimuris]|uniref:flavodoxin family protein n=1 Tax=Veillonella agrestimuris TaxID=2941340 RepID=UPI00203EEE5B|nr:flavodoxin family protein [Veillonella agrestimuris]
MKVVAFNGSPKINGNTYHALQLVGKELEMAGIKFEIIHVGNQSIRGCIACGNCSMKQNEQCIITNDIVNESIQKVKEAAGILLGSPVHYSGVPGTMKSFLDRLFYVSTSNGNLFRHKVGAAIVADRREGGISTLNELNYYLSYSEIMIPTSNYWNIIYGTTPGEIVQDIEGTQIMRILGKNMAYLIKIMASSKGIVEAPEKEDKVYTHTL